MREIVLGAKALTKVYGKDGSAVHALRGVDVEIRRGSFTAIIGKSGCGKSTLLQALGGLDVPTGGQVFLEGQDLYSLPDEELARLRRTRLGFVFQAFHLLPEYTIRDNILLPLMLENQKPDREYLDFLVERLGLKELLHRQPGQLSGGQQQRAAIARALIARPAVVLADEPTGNLDRRNSEEVFAMLRAVASEQHQTVVYVTHDPDLARSADRVLQMEDGRIVSDCIPAEHPDGGAKSDRELYQAQRRASHEFQAQLDVLGQLMQEQDYAAAQEYLQAVSGRQARRLVLVDCRHPVLNALFNVKAGAAESRGVEVRFEVNDLSELPFDPADLTVLLSNLLDNAVEACEKAPQPRIIEVRALKEKSFFFSVRNTSLPVTIRDGQISTTKPHPELHGFGLPNVKAMVQKYKGDCAMQYGDGWFQFAGELPLI